MRVYNSTTEILEQLSSSEKQKAISVLEEVDSGVRQLPRLAHTSDEETRQMKLVLDATNGSWPDSIEQEFYSEASNLLGQSAGEALTNEIIQEVLTRSINNPETASRILETAARNATIRLSEHQEELTEALRIALEAF